MASRGCLQPIDEELQPTTKKKKKRNKSSSVVADGAEPASAHGAAAGMSADVLRRINAALREPRGMADPSEVRSANGRLWHFSARLTSMQLAGGAIGSRKPNG